MRFLNECKADASADLVYRVCPMHLLEPVELIKDMKRVRCWKSSPTMTGPWKTSRPGAPSTGRSSSASAKMRREDLYKLYIRKVH